MQAGLGMGRRAPVVVDNVVVGGGIAAGAILHGLARSGNAGRVLVITRGDRWPMAFPRHHLLGQSRQGLTLSKQAQFMHPSGRMSAEEHMREVADYQIRAIEPFRGEDIDCLETDVTRVVRQGQREVRLECADSSMVVSKRVFLATGVGPERGLEQCGVTFENQAGARRQVFHEVTTALQSMGEDPSYWRRKRVTVYGGGATAAWIVEVTMSHPLRDLRWLAAKGFGGANPGNRNSETLELTKDRRYQAAITRVRYLGGLNSPPGSGSLEVTTDHAGSMRTFRTDVVICAAGADPMAATGIESVLGPLYKELVPVVGKQKGVFARIPDGSVVVTSSALSHNPEIQALIQGTTFPTLNPENHVVAGVAVTKLSAEDAVEAMAG